MNTYKEVNNMKAIGSKKDGDSPRLVWEDVADIHCGPEEVLVDVKASAVNRADLLQAMGNYPPPPGITDIIGLEMSGVIAHLGSEVDGWQPGDRVMALLPGGGYAERAVVNHQLLVRLPDSWTFIQGGAVPEVWLTAYSNLFMEGNLDAGDTVLLHAGASGVGTAGIQMAHNAGARVIITAGAEEKLTRCRGYGASLAINYKSQDFFETVLDATDGKGVDVILDPVGGSYLNKNLRALAERGRLINIGLLGGTTAELDMGLILGKSLRIIGTRLRARALSEKIDITRRFTDRFWPLLVDGTLEPVIDRIFPMAQAQQAHDYIRENRNIGKVILEVGE
jgi:tumor protein p53-inducible protein 3